MKTEHLISRILHLGRIYDQETDESKRENLVDRLESVVEDHNKQLLLRNVSQQRELLKALKGIERECDNQNPTHENIWRIAYGAIKESNCS